jgi:hexokinase
MFNEKQVVLDFLKKYGMDHESLSMDESSKDFVEDMEKGLEGNKSSLKMIPTYITMEKEIPLEEPVIVIDAGGTNFRCAIVHFDSNKKPVINDYKTYPMPGANGEISKDEFYTTIVDYIKPLLDKSETIGFCFSYPVDMLPNKDGRLIQFSKEIRIKGLVGEVVGQGLVEAIKNMGFKGNKKIVMLNDTVATLLGGKTVYPDRTFDSYIGFILGTGTNTCYIEENTNIKKVKDLITENGSMIINIESGGFNRISSGVMDLELDNETVNPGEYGFEKMMSGRYQGDLVNKVIKKAIKEGLLSKYFADKFASIKEVTAIEFNEFLYYPYADNKLSVCCSDKHLDNETDDHLVLYYLIDSIIERAAKLVAINFVAILMKTNKGKNPCKPVCIAAEGSTFYKSKLFRYKLDYYMKKYVNDEKGLYCEYVKSDNVTLIGTAVAGLIN